MPGFPGRGAPKARLGRIPHGLPDARPPGPTRPFPQWPCGAPGLPLDADIPQKADSPFYARGATMTTVGSWSSWSVRSLSSAVGLVSR
jgi:hypothetical protein